MALWLAAEGLVIVGADESLADGAVPSPLRKLPQQQAAAEAAPQAMLPAVAAAQIAHAAVGQGVAARAVVDGLEQATPEHDGDRRLQVAHT